MPSRTREIVTRWTSPRCVACGVEAVRAIRLGVAACDACGCRFDERPPRSYADLEGLTTSHLARHWRPVRKTETRLSLPGLAILSLLAGFAIAAAIAELS
jgi:ribosomal protein L37AE/L43A